MKVALLFLLMGLLAAPAAANVYTRVGPPGTWSDPEKWDPEGVPGAGDTAVIPWGSSTITMDGAITVAVLMMEGGTLEGPYDITVTERMVWTAGSIRGEGNLLSIPVGARMEVEGGSSLAYGRRIENHGMIAWSGRGLFSLRDGTVLHNFGSFQASSDANLEGQPGTTFINEPTGVIRRVAGEGVTRFGLNEFRSVGTIEVSSGVLRLNVEGKIENTVHIAADGVLEMGSRTHTFTPESDIVGDGQLVFTLGTTVFERDLVLPTTTRFQGGTINGPVHFTVPTDATLVLEDGSSGRNLNDVVITNHGTILWEDSRPITIRETTIHNHALFEMTGDGTIVRSGDPETNTIQNHPGAVIRKSGGDGMTRFRNGIVFINNGTTEILSGRLDFDTGSATGSFLVGGGATLSFSKSRPYMLAPQSVLEGDGNVSFFAGDVFIEGTYDIQGETRVHGGRAMFANVPVNPGVRQIIESPLGSSGGSLLFEQPVTLPEVRLNGGTLGGDADITISGSLVWSRGNVEGNGDKLIIPAVASLRLDDRHSRHLKHREVHLEGSGVIEGERGFHLYFTESAIINRGRLEIRAHAERTVLTVPQGGGASNRIVNTAQGKLRVVGSERVRMSTSLEFYNEGDLIIEGAYFEHQGGENRPPLFTHRRGRIALIDGTLDVNWGVRDGGQFTERNYTVVIEDGVLEGYGIINADVINRASLRVGLPDENGMLYINGRYEQSAEGTLSIGIGGYVAGETFDQLLTFEAEVGGRLEVTFADGFLPQDDDSFRIMTWQHGELAGAYDQVDGLELSDGRSMRLHASTNNLFVRGTLATRDVFVEIVGRGQYRDGRWQTYSVVYGNDTDETIVMPITLWFPAGVEVDLAFPLSTEPFVDLQDPDAEAAIRNMPAFFPDDEGGVVIPIITALGPGETGSAPVRLRIDDPVCASLDARGIGEARVGIPGTWSVNARSCASALINEALNWIPGAACVSVWQNIVQDEINMLRGKYHTGPTFMATYGLGLARCAASATPFGPIVTTTIKTLEYVAKVNRGLEVVNACAPAYMPDEGEGETFEVAEHRARCVRSWDPNEKAGVAGVGEPGFIRGRMPIAYTIFFENVDTVEVAAQDVFISDQLDPNKWDFSTFALGQITFGDWVVDVPQGLTEYAAEIDLRPQMELLVGVEASLNTASGELKWSLLSLDPETGEPTEDPLLGFLPPNVNPPEGDGSVSFIVTPNQDLPSGTELLNTASIVFDTNEPIITNTWRNTIDRTPPTSRVQELESSLSSPFEVHWAGDDTFSGVATYTIYVSENGGPFHVWIADTSAVSAHFEGAPENDYAFYSIARDAVGNRERLKFEPDAMTRVAVSIEGEDLPHVFALHGNYPNPFNPTTTIRFSLAEVAPTQVVVYNMLGQQVAILVDEMRGPGTYTAEWDASVSASGVYFVRLKQGDNLQTRKVVLLK